MLGTSGVGVLVLHVARSRGGEGGTVRGRTAYQRRFSLGGLGGLAQHPQITSGVRTASEEGLRTGSSHSSGSAFGALRGIGQTHPILP